MTLTSCGPGCLGYPFIGTGCRRSCSLRVERNEVSLHPKQSRPPGKASPSYRRRKAFAISHFAESASADLVGARLQIWRPGAGLECEG